MTVDEQPSLRERQGRQVSTEIRRAFLRLINDRGPNGFSLHDVAAEAGVSDRTLYRYYPSRDALMQGIRNHEYADLDERLRGRRASITDLRDVDAIATAFEIFEEHSDLVRAASLLRDADADGGDTARRTDEIRASIEANPGISDSALQQMVGLVRVISSTAGWMRMTSPDVGLRSREAGYAAQWAIQVLVEAAAEEDGPLRPREGGIR